MLKKQITLSFLSVLVIALTGFATIPVLTRLLPPASLGKLFSILAFVSIIQIFDGMKPVIIHHLNEAKYSDYDYLFSFKRANNIVMAVCATGIFIVTVAILSFSIYEATYLTLIFVFYSLMSMQWGLLEAKNELNTTSTFRAAGWIFTYISFIGLAEYKVNISNYFLPILLMYIVLYFVFKSRSEKYFSNDLAQQADPSTRATLARTIIRDTLINIQVQLSAVALLSMDKVIVPYFLGYTNFSYYAVQSELATKSYVINTSIRRVLFPYLANKDNTSKLIQIISLSVYLFSLALMVILIVGFFSVSLIKLYAGPAYAAHGDLFRILLLVFPINILGTIGIIFLQVNGDFNLHNRLYVIAASITLPTFIYSVHEYGLKGAAVALALSRIVDIYTFFMALMKYCRWTNISTAAIFVAAYVTLVLALALNINTLAISASLLMCVSAILSIRTISSNTSPR